MKKLVKFKAVILLLVLSVLLAACSSNSNDTSGVDDKNNNGEELVLTLGETGTIKDTLGEYAVTIESVEAHDTFDGMEPEREEFQFVLINFTVENVGETELEGDAISIPTLVSETGSRASNDISNESIDHIKDELHPGEEDSGQMIFHHYQSDDYELTFGYGMGSLSNQVTWEFSVE